MKAAGKVALLDVAREDSDEPRPAPFPDQLVRAHDDTWRASRRKPDVSEDSHVGLTPRRSPRFVRSRSSASAAIQPDISTIGMPGPGCAAPPARYRPRTSRLRLDGLNAPTILPWLASP